MNNFLKFFWVSLAFVAISCTGTKKAIIQRETLITPSGVKIEFLTRGQGPKADTGKIVVVHYIGKLTNDSVFDNSFKRGKPIRITLGKGQVIKGWDEALCYLKQGDYARLTIPPSMAYGDKDLGVIPPNSTLVFDVELQEVIKVTKPEPFKVSGLDTLTYPSGLKVITVEKGQGPVAKKGDLVSVHYSGYLSNGMLFDSSLERAMPIQFKAGMGMVIKGWDEAFMSLPMGTKARLIIPPYLGYRDREVGPIPAGSTLIFDIEILSVEKQ